MYKSCLDFQEEREKNFRSLKAGILKFLELLEQPPEDSFCQDIICSEDDDFPLGKAYLQQMRVWLNLISLLYFFSLKNEIEI